MDLTSSMQELVLGLLLYGDSKDAGVVRGMVNPDAFDVHYRRLVKAAMEYHSRYGEAPGEHAEDVIQSVPVRSEGDRKIYERIMESVQSAKDGINRQYVLESVASFEHYQRIRTKVADVLETLENQPTPEGVSRAAGMLAEAARSPNSASPSDINMSSPVHLLQVLQEEQDEVMEIDVPPYDYWKAGPERGALNIMIAPPSSGKSAWLIHLGRCAMRQGWRVCHVTVELSAKNTARRYLQSFHGFTKRELDTVEKTKLIKDEHGLVVDIDTKRIKRPGLDNLSRQSRKRMLAMAPHTRMRVKGFPSGSLTMEQLEAYLDVLEVSEGFTPDLLIIDYIDEMFIDSRNHRLEVGNLYTAVRGLAQKRHMAAASVSQANKEAEHKRWVTRSNAAEAFSKIAKADVGFTFSRTVAEEQMGLGRLSLIRARNDGGVHTRCVISQSFETGRFITDWALMEDDGYWGVIEAHGGHDIED